ncbi:flagellar motor switch protein FliM [Vagococcus hydrophili]|uniref:Flagellar motor switch protein FliM n=1 Tax=Vagococcus hydrophili TaxID=2714947 RepID=A0A6G8AW90_9ENTE|nr:flagellar motor switch protein FliM [Vagococcus hydrophili]QIL49324.1 flagellar motor switch protein FliM [Vagococcus hydrophili]
MTQVLTQQEIDALLNAMSSGEIDEKAYLDKEEESNVKSYDFRRPTKLSKEYINTLFMIFEDFSKYAGNHLTTQIRSNVSLKLASIEQISYDEFIHSIPKFTLLGLFQSTPLSGVQMIEINPQFSMILVELLCGGSETEIGKFKNQEKKGFTDIELALLEEVYKILILAFETAWNDIVELDCHLNGLDTNPQLLQNMSPNEPVVLVTCTVSVLNQKTFINLCIPYVFFEGIMDKLSFRNWFDSDKGFNQEDNDHLHKNIKSVDLGLQAVLGTTQMTLSDFINLEVGDAISLDQKISEPLKMYAGDQFFGYVKPGKKEKRLAVEVLEISEGESE